jgi:hypothetical protein
MIGIPIQISRVTMNESLKRAKLNACAMAITPMVGSSVVILTFVCRALRNGRRLSTASRRCCQTLWTLCWDGQPSPRFLAQYGTIQYYHSAFMGI